MCSLKEDEGVGHSAAANQEKKHKIGNVGRLLLKVGTGLRVNRLPH